MSFLFGGQISTDKLILQLVYVFIVPFPVWAGIMCPHDETLLRKLKLKCCQKSCPHTFHRTIVIKATRNTKEIASLLPSVKGLENEFFRYNGKFHCVLGEGVKI